jgi:hypothetical protein
MSRTIPFHKLKNHLMGDPLCDYLEAHRDTYEPTDPSEFYVELMKAKERYIQEFRENLGGFHPILDYLEPTEVLPRIRGSERMLLFRPTLCHSKHQVSVVPDLLMHRDVFRKIFTEVTHDIPEYIVIDILYKTLHFNADRTDLLNQGTTRYHKTKMWYASVCLDEMTGTTTKTGYLLAKEYRHKGDMLPKKQCIGSFTLKGYRGEFMEARSWIRRLSTQSKEWVIFPEPSVPELFPNMNHKSEIWQREKYGIAEILKEVTLMWCLTLKQRDCLWEKGVTQWDDPLLLHHIYPFQVKENHRHTIQEKMIDLNRQTDVKIMPRTLTNREFRDVVLHQENSIILDIETVGHLEEKESYFGECVVRERPTICIIGTIMNRDSYVFKDFTIRYLTYAEERTIIEHWIRYLGKMCSQSQPIRVYHWGHAEVTYLNYMKTTYPDLKFPEFQMVDLLGYFRKEPITIQGCFGYGLKSIVKALYGHQLIDSYWEEELSGLDALQEVLKTSELAKRQNVPIKRFAEIRKIIYYNYMDCRVLVDLLGLLQTLC